MRLVLTGNGTRELRFEPKASGVIAGGTLTSVCITGAAYTVQGLRSLTVPGKWACGGSALVSSFRKSGQPVYAWNTRLPADTKIKERVSVLSKDRWQWDYVATSKILGAREDDARARLEQWQAGERLAHRPHGHHPLHVQLHNDLRADRAALRRTLRLEPRRGRAQEIPRLADVALLRPQVADREADREPAAEAGVRQEQTARALTASMSA